jgi:hypothetical protein
MTSISRRIALGAGVCAAASVALSACFTGDRPSFDDTVSAAAETGDPAVDAVLDRLDAVQGSVFTAEYEIRGANGDQARATVVQADGGRRAITVGDVRYVLDGEEGITCNLSTSECEATVNDRRISNLQLTHDFYAPAFATRLRVDANRRIHDPTSSTERIGRRKATCVVVPVSGGEKTYCALDAGPLARYVGPDVDIELVRFSPRPDESQFATS